MNKSNIAQIQVDKTITVSMTDGKYHVFDMSQFKIWSDERQKNGLDNLDNVSIYIEEEDYSAHFQKYLHNSHEGE